MDTYIFSRNNDPSPISIHISSGAGSVYYTNSISSNISINSQTSFAPSVTGIYLITYDIKITGQGPLYIFIGSSPISFINGSNIITVHSPFLSLNRVFLAQLTGGSQYNVYLAPGGGSIPSSVDILGGTNGPQILITQIA